MKVTIIIPNYNGKHFMEPCLASLNEQTCRDFKILIVDNASTDGSLEYMEQTYPDIEVLALDSNYGFSRAVNEGIRHADTPYVILLNNDTTVDSRYVEEMIRAIEVSDRIFSVSSKMIQMYHPDLIDSAGDLYTLMGWGVCRGAGRPVSNYTEDDTVFTACALRHNWKDLINLISLTRYRIKKSRSFTEFIRLRQNICTGAVYRNRKICYFLDTVDHPFQSFNFLFFRNRCTTVNKRCIRFCLFSCTILDKFSVSVGDCFCHGRNRTIDLFANNNHLLHLLKFSFRQNVQSMNPPKHAVVF